MKEITSELYKLYMKCQRINHQLQQILIIQIYHNYINKWINQIKFIINLNILFNLNRHTINNKVIISDTMTTEIQL